jgi:hypothetical protein
MDLVEDDTRLAWINRRARVVLPTWRGPLKKTIFSLRSLAIGWCR